jgi:hypothetical protein
MVEENERVCSKCGSTFKTVNTELKQPKCFPCTIEEYPPIQEWRSSKIWSWDSLAKAFQQSGAKIPRHYAEDSKRQKACEFESIAQPIAMRYGVGIRVHLELTAEQMAMVENNPS